MIETIELMPGVTLRCCRDTRFKQNCMTFQFIQEAGDETASLDALLPSVLMRGCESYPTLQAIANRADSLYGAAVGTLVRTVGDYHTTGLSFSSMEERFALPGDKILCPMLELMEEMLFSPVLENGVFPAAVVEQEKRNLLQYIDSMMDNKQTLALYKLGRFMGRKDPHYVSRLGEPEIIREITPESLYAHYRKLLRCSPFEIFYVGSAEPEAIASLLHPWLSRLDRDCTALPAHTGFLPSEGAELTEVMDVAQGKLCMGFVSTIDNRSPEIAALVIMNVIFGSGMTSKLFLNVREKLSLCYSVGSSLRGAKGLIFVYAGIDCDKEEVARKEILHQLDLCKQGQITREELESARQSVLSALATVTDSPRSIESTFSADAITGSVLKHEAYVEAIRKVTMEQVIAAANTVTLHSTLFLKGGAHE